MKKILVIAMALSLLMVSGAFAEKVDCPDYTIGYTGCITFCLAPGIVIGANGAAATLSTPEGQSKVAYADCSGKYTVKKKLNNCGTSPLYSYPQAWKVTLDLLPSMLGVGTFSCETSQTFLCCCPVCNQKVIAKCDKKFKGPCCDI